MLQPIAPSKDDLEEIIKVVAKNGDEDSVRGLLEDAAIARFDNYMSDGPGFNGQVFVVIWPGGPEIIDVLTRSDGGKLVCNVVDDNRPGEDPWGEDSSYPRIDWQYEVVNNYTTLGYWRWVESRRDLEEVLPCP